MHVPLFALLVATLQPAAAPDLSPFSATQRETFDAVAADEFCGCDSALTLKGCLAERPDCGIATDVGQVLKGLVQTNAPKQMVASFLSQKVLGPYCSLPQSIATEGAPRMGPKDAPIQIIEMADFRCLHCRHAVPLVHAALKKWGNKVSLVYMPVAMVPNSPSTAAVEASLAAAAQDKFWPMHKALFAREAGDFTPEVLRQIAGKVGLDMKRFNQDMAKHTHQKTLEKFMDRFNKAGLDGTPAFFINGRRYEMEPTVFALDARIQMELDRNVGNCK
jgi:protein-disulfide isomerase